MSHIGGDLASALEELAAQARRRYGEALVRITAGDGILVGSVGVSAQLRQLRELQSRHRVGMRVLVLAERRARFALHPDGGPLPVWRRPEPDAELTTELLPGDPPAEVVGGFPQHYLVRAPGEAVGWVMRSSPHRPGPPGLPGGLTPVEGALGQPWDPEAVIETALAQLGRPYVWGGTGSAGMDCSGLVWRSYLTAGLLLPRNSRAQRLVGARIGRSELGRADLVAAVSRGPHQYSHVALAISGQAVVHACSELRRIRREPLSEFEDRYRIVTLRRIPGGRPVAG